jgi:hypothetical protein
MPEQWKESVIVHIYKKGDKTHCSNYRGMSVLLTAYKTSSSILPSRLKTYIGEIIGNHQCGFSCCRPTADQSFCICQILEKKWEYNGMVYQLFIDSEKS